MIFPMKLFATFYSFFQKVKYYTICLFNPENTSLVKIISTYFFSLIIEQVLWNIGFTSRRLLQVSLTMLSEIELNWTKSVETQDNKHSLSTTIKNEVMKLQQIYDTEEVIQSIKVNRFFFQEI